jgi:hypothetical protein
VRDNPLRRGYSEKTLRANIAAERRAGRGEAQANAIAYRMARESWRDKHPRGPFPAHLKRQPPKGRTRGTRRGKPQQSAGRRSATK